MEGHRARFHNYNKRRKMIKNSVRIMETLQIAEAVINHIPQPMSREVTDTAMMLLESLGFTAFTIIEENGEEAAQSFEMQEISRVSEKLAEILYNHKKG